MENAASSGSEAPASREDWGFGLQLGNVVDALSEASKRVQTQPTFPNVVDACLAGRIAWDVLFSEWQVAGGCRPELVERVRGGLSRCMQAVLAASREISVDDCNRELMAGFAHSIGFRIEMLHLLASEGPAAVVAAVEQQDERRRRQRE